MKKNFLFVLLSVSFLTSQSGCSMWNTTFKNPNDHVSHLEGDYKKKTQAEELVNEDEDDDWAFVGKEGRDKKHLSSNPEKKSWVDKYFKNPTTRSIEQNLGVY